MHPDIATYNNQQTAEEGLICNLLASLIDQEIPQAENKIWHAHPVWFINGNPVVGYSKLKNCIRLLFWSGQSFEEDILKHEGKFKAAEIRYTAAEQVNVDDLKRWLEKAVKIQWDYKNMVKRKGRLELMLVFYLMLFSIGINAQNQLPKVSSGIIERIDSFPSRFVTSRNIDIWLPDGYSSQKKYAVLYMHDGQMLFDSAITWNHQEWKVDEVAATLIKNKLVRDFIVVGIWNGGTTRHSDYFPQKPYEWLNATDKDTIIAQLQRAGRTKNGFQPVSDNYLRFIAKELKPYIDKQYSVYKDRGNTFIAGSSMGGLISLYAICEYPKVFGGAACLSTHWIGIFSAENNPIPNAFFQYISHHLPNPKNHKLYFDYGDQTLDAFYPPIQKEVDHILITKGFTERSWKTIFFEGDDHSEKSWSKRLKIPLTFLLN